MLIQRSRGYGNRPAFSAEQIGEIARAVKDVDPSINVMVDNCYGEFTGEHEPTEYGVDLMAGSLIKNPGGGLAPTGGYVVGKAELVEKPQCVLQPRASAVNAAQHSAIIDCCFKDCLWLRTLLHRHSRLRLFALQ